jgi:hypothetical protein
VGARAAAGVAAHERGRQLLEELLELFERYPRRDQVAKGMVASDCDATLAMAL